MSVQTIPEIFFVAFLILLTTLCKSITTLYFINYVDTLNFVVVRMYTWSGGHQVNEKEQIPILIDDLLFYVLV